MLRLIIICFLLVGVLSEECPSGYDFPPIPRMESATFSKDGSYLIVQWDYPVDGSLVIGDSNIFQCGILFSFPGASSSTSCQFVTGSTVYVYLNGASIAKVNDFFTMRGGTLLAQCPDDYPECVCGAFEAVPERSVNLLAPAEVTVPTVVVPNTIAASICSPPSIDVSMSYGSGGRSWSSVTVTVDSTSSTAGALKDFLEASDFTTKAVSVTSDLLESGNSYTLGIELCNFLGGCSTGTTVITVQSDALPYVSILGSAATSVDVFKVLDIEASATLPLCDNTFVHISKLIFDWTISLDGVDVDVTQTSRDRTKYRLPAYSLESGKTYEIKCKVSNEDNLAQTSSATVSVTVTPGDVIAVILGEDSRLLPFENSIQLDASESYDQNIGLLNNDHLSYSWGCVQTGPSALSSCPTLGLSNINTAVLTIVNTAPSFDDYEFELTVTVSDSADLNRVDSKTISVTLLQSTAPLVVVTNPSTSAKFNNKGELTLNGEITILSTAVHDLRWSVDNLQLSNDFSDQSLSALDGQLSTPGLYNFPLVLRSRALTRGVNYVFTLTCGSSQATVRVQVNDPPRPGDFKVSPATGTEITTPFEFSTAFWTDEDTPIEYEFGIISNDLRLVLQPRSLVTALETSLPAGKDSNGYELVTYVRVFDNLNAVEESTFTVVVEAAGSEDELLDELGTFVDDVGTVSELKKALSLTTSVINNQDCSNAPDCAALNREVCGSVTDTCGPCEDGFFGDIGEQNSLCITAAELSVVRSGNSNGASCSTGDDCDNWYSCTGGICVADSKECVAGCSGNGNCNLVHIATGFGVSQCPIYDFTCRAVCECSSGFYGSICDVPENELTKLSDLREKVLSGLEEVATLDNPSADAALSLIASLTAASDQVSELTSAGAETALQIANTILASSEIDELSGDDISGLLSSLDSVLQSSVSSTDGRRLAGVTNVRKNVIASLDSYGQVIGEKHLVVGQESRKANKKAFLTSIQKFGAGSSFTAKVASSNADVLGLGETTASLDSTQADSDLLIILHSLGSPLYPEVTKPMHSDGIRAVVQGRNVSKTFTFVIAHNQVMNYQEYPSNVSFVTTCSKRPKEETFECPDDFTITHTCNGTDYYTMTSFCPSKRDASYCENLEESGGSECVVKSFSATETVCECTVKPSGRRRNRRSLSGADDSGYIEVGAMTEVVADDFVTTAYEARNFDSLDDVQEVLTIIIMFGVMWAFGLGSTWYYAIRGATKDRKAELNEQMNLQKKMASATNKTTVENIKKYLDMYVTEVFPAVFRSSPWHERLITEIKKHHRYLTIFTGGGDPRVRLMTTVHLLTIQSMLMFILAVFYDIQFPVDDGECQKLGPSSCEDEKSVFDHEESKCSWNPDLEECEYIEPYISEQMIALISVIVAIATAPINLVVDFLFDDILSAPTADAVKLSAEPNAIQRAGRQLNAARRASVSAVRRASVSLQHAIAPVTRRQSSKFGMSSGTTRMIPESTVSAQSLAKASVADALGTFKESQKKYEDERNSIVGTTTSKTLVNVRRGRGAAGQSAARPPVPVDLPGALGFGSSADARFSELCKEIAAQRRRLKPSEQEDFDARWGFDPNGEFNRESALSGLCCRKKGPETVIKDELEFVAKEVQEKHEKLKIATDAHTGLELLHLFVLDLLGRDTPAAQIFSSKTSEDFRHAMIISSTLKMACWIFIILLNFIFVYFAMLRGLERGKEWQYGYAIACVIQFVVEIVMFETVECIWVHYLIPDAASAEIYAAQHSLKRTINSLCSTASANATYILDVPKYMFVSTNLAEKFPDMLESMIIRSYHYHLPGEMEKKWHISYERGSILVRLVRNFSVFAITISLLQWVGSSPLSLQRAVIHTVNPLLFGGIFILCVFLYKNPVYFTIIVGLIIYKVAHHAWKEYVKYRAQNVPKKFERMVSNVVPIPAGETAGSRGSSAESNRSARSINSISVMPLSEVNPVDNVELTGLDGQGSAGSEQSSDSSSGEESEEDSSQT